MLNTCMCPNFMCTLPAVEKVGDFFSSENIKQKIAGVGDTKHI